MPARVVGEAAGKGGGGDAAFVGGPADELVGVDPVQGEEASRHDGVEAQDVFVAEEMPGLLGRALALGAHQDLDGVARPGQQSAAVESAAAMAHVVRGPEAEDPDRVERHAERADGLGQRDHYRVVRPDPAVDQSGAVQAPCREGRSAQRPWPSQRRPRSRASRASGSAGVGFGTGTRRPRRCCTR